MKVQVQDVDGRELKETTPHRARLLLQAGRAAVVCRSPFTIRLKKAAGQLGPAVENDSCSQADQIKRKPARRPRPRINWTDPADLVTIGTKIPRAVAQFWASEAKRQGIPVGYVIAEALIEAFGAPADAIRADDSS